MKSIIIGGGKLGYYLLKTLIERNNNVTLIEKKKHICEEIAEDFNIDVILGDGSDPEVLKESGIENAEIVAAMTGQDEENIVICKISKECFNINKTIARVNNPKNITTFKALGVDNTFCSTELIANLIEWEFENTKVNIVHTFHMGSMVLVNIHINKNSIWLNKLIKDISLPKECTIVSIIRNENIIYPKGNTIILINDKVLAVTNLQTLPEFNKMV